MVVSGATRFRDYILTAYEPRVDPTDKLHCASLLKALLREHDMLAAWAVCDRLRAHLGEDETVWGFKQGGGEPSLELYFYNFDGAPRHAKSVTEIARVLAPQLSFAAVVDEAQPYFMCSFEIDRAALARGDGGCFRIYVGSGDEERRECGFSYRVEAESLPLENHYWFYRARVQAELGDAVRRLQRSPRAGAKPCWGRLMPAYLRDCFTICYAVKPRHDGLYYSRLGTEQVVRFLRDHTPGALADLLAAHAEDFAHQRWDLGFDFAATSPAATKIRVNKLALHGVL